MSQNKLHIISFDNPYPPDYGGAIDVFYKIKALAETGAEIYLHCFEYGRIHSSELEKLCKKVWYYPRKTGFKGVSLSLPYIVYSRRNKELLNNLCETGAPILFEGVHTTYYLSHPALKNRFKAVRIHNIEHAYYYELYRREQHLLKRIYYNFEASLLKPYESCLQAANAFFPLSMADTDFFQNLYPGAIHRFIAPFHPYHEVKSKTGKGEYCLYHGNLSHPENIEAALFLVKEVFPQLHLPVIIAGREPAPAIIDACNNLNNCTLMANPDAQQMEQLILDAHIHVLPTFQATGMKLKLLFALFRGRHVIVNDTMLNGTGLADACSLANSSDDFVATVKQKMELPFTQTDINQRNKILSEYYNNRDNATRLLNSLPL